MPFFPALLLRLNYALFLPALLLDPKAGSDFDHNFDPKPDPKSDPILIKMLTPSCNPKSAPILI